jgi:hypothetical protein
MCVGISYSENDKTARPCLGFLTFSKFYRLRAMASSSASSQKLARKSESHNGRTGSLRLQDVPRKPRREGSAPALSANGSDDKKSQKAPSAPGSKSSSRRASTLSPNARHGEDSGVSSSASLANASTDFHDTQLTVRQVMEIFKIQITQEPSEDDGSFFIWTLGLPKHEEVFA